MVGFFVMLSLYNKCRLAKPVFKVVFVSIPVVLFVLFVVLASEHGVIAMTCFFLSPFSVALFVIGVFPYGYKGVVETLFDELRCLKTSSFYELLTEDMAFIHKKTITPLVKEYMDAKGMKSFCVGRLLEGEFVERNMFRKYGRFRICNLFFSKNAYDTVNPQEETKRFFYDVDFQQGKRVACVFASIHMPELPTDLQTYDVDTYLSQSQRFFLHSVCNDNSRAFIKDGQLVILIPKKEFFCNTNTDKVYEDACFLRQLISLAGNVEHTFSFQQIDS